MPAPDKSISHRAVIISTLTKGTSEIQNLLVSKDVLSTLKWAKSLGANVNTKENITTITTDNIDWSFASKQNYLCNMGNSGTSCRLITGIMAGIGANSVIYGDSSLHKRPMQRIIEPLLQMGANIICSAIKNNSINLKTKQQLLNLETNDIYDLLPSMHKASLNHKENYLPIYVQQSKLTKIDYNLKIASAQVKSAILFAGLCSGNKVVVNEIYKTRDHTENMLVDAGAEVKVSKNNVVLSSNMNQLHPIKWIIPGDFSSASFFIIAALIVPKSHIIIQNINLNPLRSGLLNVLKAIGANVIITYKKNVCGEPFGDIEVKYTYNLKPIEVNKESVPSMIDEFPILFCLACTIKGVHKFYGIEDLRHKESDRITSMESMLNKLGVKTQSTNDSIIIFGKTFNTDSKVTINANLDHRVAMSAVVLGLCCTEGILIEGAETIDTSFPNFIQLINSLGANVIKK